MSSSSKEPSSSSPQTLANQRSLIQENKRLRDMMNRMDIEYLLSSTIINQLEVGACITDKDGLILQSSQAFSQITGIPEKELKGVPMESLILKEDVDDFKAFQKLILEKRVQNRIELRLLNDQNQVVTVRLSFAQERVRPEITRRIYILEDISAFSQYRELLHITQEMSQTGGWELDPLTRQMVWTEEIYRIMGVPKGTPVNLDDTLKYFFKESAARARRTFELTESMGVPGSEEFEVINEEGKFFIIHATSKAKYINGKIVKLYGTFRDVTQEKRELEDITRSEQVHRSLTENFPNGIILTINRGFEIQFANGQGLKDLNLTSDQLVKHSLKLLMENGFDRILEEKLWDTFDGKYTDIETKFRGNDYALEMRPLRNTLGDIEQVLVVCIDVTERTLWEKELQASEARYRELFESNPNPILVVDPDSNQILEANHTAIRHYGYTQREFQGLQYDDLINDHSADPQEDIAGLAPEQHRTKSGDQIYVEVQSNPIQYLSGTGILKIINDVTQRLRATQALHSSHNALEQFHVALDTASLVVTLNDNGDFVSTNDNFCQACGVEKGTLEQKNLQRFPRLLPDRYNWVQIIRCIREGMVWKGELELKRDDDTPLFLASTIIPNYEGGDEQASLLIISQDVTEMKLAERQLVEYSKRSTTILESITDAMFLVNPEWMLTYINSQGEKLLQVDRDEILYQSLRKVFDHEDGKAFLDKYKEAFDENRDVHFERFYSPLNTWFEVHAFPSSEGLSVYFRSINERKEAEERIRDSENSLKEAQRIARMGNWEYRVGSNEVIWSDELFRLFNLDPLTDTPSLDIVLHQVNREDKPRVFRSLRKALSEGHGFDLDFRLTAEEAGRYLNFICRPELDQDGEVDKLYGILIDITERKEAEKKLIDSKNRLREAQQLGKMGSWEYFPHEDNLHFSEEVGRILGVETLGIKAVAFTDHLEYIHEDDRDLLLKAIRKATNRADSFNLDFRLHLPEQPLRYLNAMGEASLGADREVTKLYGTIMDITQRKQAETQLMVRNEELKKTNAELDRFVYSASHDLRAPMVSVLGLINLAKKETELDRLHEYMLLMEKSVRKLDTFVQEIIHYSRNSRLEVKADPIDFKEMIEEVIEGLQFMEEAKLVRRELFFDVSEDFFTDYSRLNVVIHNMISNAFRYSSPHRRDPYLNIYVRVKNGKATLKFEDNGQGIGEDHLKDIFKMFYRASENSKGSGLGLYIVKESMEKLKGEISVSSVLGQGTTFTIELPCLTPNPVQEEEENAL